MCLKKHSVIPCFYKREQGRDGEGSGAEGRGEKGRGVNMLHTDRHTEPPTKRILEEHSLLKKVGIITKF